MYIHYYSANYDIAQNVSHVQCDRFLIHSHSYFEIYYFIRGDVDLIYDGQLIRLQPHSLTLINSGVPHGFRVLSEKDYERFTVHFTQDILSEKIQKLVPELFESKEQLAQFNHVRNMGTTNVVRIMEELVQMYNLPPDQRDALAPHMIEALLICIYRSKNAAGALARATNDSAFSSRHIIEYINNHLTAPLTLTGLSKTFYCSKGYLNNLFKRETGFTVMNYIQQCRLKYARMLIENHYSASNACTMAGFNDYSSFFRAYVKQFGVSPSNVTPTPTPPGKLMTPPCTDGVKRDSGERKIIWEPYYDGGQQEDDPSRLHDA